MRKTARGEETAGPVTETRWPCPVCLGVKMERAAPEIQPHGVPALAYVPGVEGTKWSAGWTSGDRFTM